MICFIRDIYFNRYMEIKLTESQFANIVKRILKEQTEEVLELPAIKFFFNDWNEVIKYVEEEGNPLFSMQGNLDFRNVCPETLGRLYSVEDFLGLFACENITSLGNLTHVGGYLDLRFTKVTSLGNLTHVGNNLELFGCKNLTSLGNLRDVGKNLVLYGCKNLKSLGNLTHVKGDLDLRGTNITSLGSLTHVEGFLDLFNCEKLTYLGSLTHVGGFLDLRYTPIAEKYSREEIRKMVNVEGDIYL